MPRKKGQSVSDKRLPARLRIVPDEQEPQQDTVAARAPLGTPTKPDWIEKNKRLSELWDDIVGTLGETGLLTKADGAALEIALMHWASAYQAGSKLLEDGPVNDDMRNGRKQKNPASTILAMQSRSFLDYAKQLGLTFVARARIDMPESAVEEDYGKNNPFALKQ